MSKIRFMRLAGVVIAILMTLGLAAPAQARGGGGGGSSGGHSSFSSSSGSSSRSYSAPSRSSGSSSSGRASTAPKSSSRPSGGRSTKAPTNQKSTTASGRSTKAPSRTGSNSPAPRSRTSTKYVKATTGRISTSKSTRASGGSYTVPGGSHTYTYTSTRSYYSTYHGGYPLYGSSAYWLVYNDPFYYPNYALYGSPWYGHQYPVGYVVSNGQFVSAPSSHTAIWIVLGVILGVAIFAAVVYLIWRRRNRPGSFANR